MPIPSQHRDPERPYRLAHGRIDDFPEAEAAAVDLTSELLFYGVKKRLVNEIMVAAVNAHHKHKVPGDRLRAWLQEGVIDAKERQSRVRAIDKSNDLDSQGVNHLSALREVVRCLFCDFRLDADYQEIDAYWTGILPGTPGPGIVTLPYGVNGSDRQVAAILMRHLGPPEPFVYTVHGKCKPKDLLTAFMTIARFAKPRDKAGGASESADLVQAILDMHIWRTDVTESISGPKSRQYKIRLETKPGIYPTEGVALLEDEDTGALMLYVLAGAVTPMLPERWKRRKPAEIKALLWSAPGSVKGPKQYTYTSAIKVAFNGNWKTIAVNVNAFRSAVEAAEHESSRPQAQKALDPNDDGREPAVIVTPYSASPAASPADHTAFMLSDAASPLPASDRLPQAHAAAGTAGQPSLTLHTRENPVSFPGDTLVSEQGRDEKSVATLPDAENPNGSARFLWQR